MMAQDGPCSMQFDETHYLLAASLYLLLEQGRNSGNEVTGQVRMRMKHEAAASCNDDLRVL